MFRSPYLPVYAILALACASSPVKAEVSDLGNFNFTGPLITPNPAGLPQGRCCIEPYLVRVDSSSYSDESGEASALR